MSDDHLCRDLVGTIHRREVYCTLHGHGALCAAIGLPCKAKRLLKVTGLEHKLSPRRVGGTTSGTPSPPASLRARALAPARRLPFMDDAERRRRAASPTVAEIEAMPVELCRPTLEELLAWTNSIYRRHLEP